MKEKGSKFKRGFLVPALIAVFVAVFAAFTGGTRAYADSTGVSGFVTRLYEQCLNREPDASGLDYWVKGLNAATYTGAQASVNFIFSSEFVNKNVSDDEFLNIMYKAFFDRLPDDSGKNYWIGKLASGISRLYVNAAFVNSAEFNSICTSFGINRGSVVLTKPVDLHPDLAAFTYRFYDKCLSRKPDDSGLNYWVNSLTTGTSTGAQMSLGFVFSAEFTGKNLPDADFAAVMYRVFFDREPDSGGQAYWEGKLIEGFSRRYILASFVGSQEFKNLCASSGINNGSIALTKDDMAKNPGFYSTNIENLGFAASEGDWIYYIDMQENCLYKKKSDNTGKVKISTDSVSFLNVLNGWIYYRNDSDGGSLYKIKTDGTGRTKLNSDDVTYVYLVGQTLYYYNNLAPEGLYAVNSDGTGRRFIASLTANANDTAVNLIVDGDWLYYIQYSDGYMYKIKLDGTGKTAINNNLFYNCSDMVKIGDWIYFLNKMDGGKLYKIKPDGTGVAVVNSDNNAISINVSGDWIVYSFCQDVSHPENGGKLYKIKADGTEKTAITEDGPGLLNIVGDWIYYINNAAGGEMYRVKLDGTGRGPVDMVSEANTVVNTVGNTNGNVMNEGISAVQGDWIYYSANHNLFKSKTDGSSDIELVSGVIDNVNVSGDWIYYTEYNGVGDQYNWLYKVKLDGSCKTRLTTDYCQNVVVSGDWIFYISKWDNSKPYKIRTDGTGKTPVTNDGFLTYNLIGDWIYYVNNNSIKRVKTDGSASEVFLSGYSGGYEILISGDWIYYRGYYDNDTLYKMKTDGTGNVKLYQGTFNNVILDGDKIYLNEYTHGIYSISSADGSGKTQIFSGDISKFSISGGFLFYINRPDSSYHAIKL